MATQRVSLAIKRVAVLEGKVRAKATIGFLGKNSACNSMLGNRTYMTCGVAYYFSSLIPYLRLVAITLECSDTRSICCV